MYYSVDYLSDYLCCLNLVWVTRSFDFSYICWESLYNLIFVSLCSHIVPSELIPCNCLKCLKSGIVEYGANKTLLKQHTSSKNEKKI